MAIFSEKIQIPKNSRQLALFKLYLTFCIHKALCQFWLVYTLHVKRIDTDVQIFRRNILGVCEVAYYKCKFSDDYLVCVCVCFFSVLFCSPLLWNRFTVIHHACLSSQLFWMLLMQLMQVEQKSDSAIFTFVKIFRVYFFEIFCTALTAQ